MPVSDREIYLPKKVKFLYFLSSFNMSTNLDPVDQDSLKIKSNFSLVKKHFSDGVEFLLKIESVSLTTNILRHM